MSCCDVNGLNSIFRGSYVEREKAKFLKQGLSKRQQGFLQLELANLSVLDIGCGIGALAFSALKRGAKEAHLVDVSRAYLKAAHEIALALELENKMTLSQGDFVGLSQPFSADLVMLDRVVCCYPNAPELLKKAAQSSQHYLIFSQPRPLWFMQLGKTLLNSMMKLSRNAYRFYLHDDAELIQTAQSNGHQLIECKTFGLWEVKLFKRFPVI